MDLVMIVLLVGVVGGAVVAVRGEKSEDVEADPQLDIAALRVKLDTDRGVVKARERVATAEAEARAYSEKVARVLSSAHPDTVKGNLPIRPMPERIVEAHRVAVGDLVRAKRDAFKKHQPDVEVHFEQRRQQLRTVWRTFQTEMAQLDSEEVAVAKLAPHGVQFCRSAVPEYVSDVGWREWERRTWPPPPPPRAVRKEVVLEG